MNDVKETCAACGLPGHRYGRNEGLDRFNPMACINSLRAVIEELEPKARAYVELLESVDAEHWLHDDCECHHKGLAVAWHTTPCVLAEVKRLIYRLKAAVVPVEADGE